MAIKKFHKGSLLSSGYLTIADIWMLSAVVNGLVNFFELSD